MIGRVLPFNRQTWPKLVRIHWTVYQRGTNEQNEKDNLGQIMDQYLRVYFESVLGLDMLSSFSVTRTFQPQFPLKDALMGCFWMERERTCRGLRHNGRRMLSSSYFSTQTILVCVETCSRLNRFRAKLNQRNRFDILNSNQNQFRRQT